MILLCWLFGHRDEIRCRVMPTIRNIIVNHTHACQRCGHVRETFSEHPYTERDFCTFDWAALHHGMSRELAELEALYKLEAK